MSKAKQSTALVPTASDAEVVVESYTLSYVGVPDHIKEECEALWTNSKAQLVAAYESLQPIYERLTPYGRWKDWCREHDVPYARANHWLHRDERLQARRVTGDTAGSPRVSAAQPTTSESAELWRVLVTCEGKRQAETLQQQLERRGFDCDIEPVEP